MQNILLFVDLDDTLFQTKRKNSAGCIPATDGVQSERISYMTQAQQLFLELFISSAQVKVIPTTARDLQQYQRTLLSRHRQVSTAILYCGGVIFEKDQEDKQWQHVIRQAYTQLKTPILPLLTQIADLIQENPLFTLYNVDDYYITVKAQRDCPTIARDALFTQLKILQTNEYFIHQNERMLSFIPHFLNKQYAVQYLIGKYKPDLTLGAGDNPTDHPFMQQCDFQIFPKKVKLRFDNG